MFCSLMRMALLLSDKLYVPIMCLLKFAVVKKTQDRVSPFEAADGLLFSKSSEFLKSDKPQAQVISLTDSEDRAKEDRERSDGVSIPVALSPQKRMERLLKDFIDADMKYVAELDVLLAVCFISSFYPQLVFQSSHYTRPTMALYKRTKF